jgi:hypothetical protein
MLHQNTVINNDRWVDFMNDPNKHDVPQYTEYDISLRLGHSMFDEGVAISARCTKHCPAFCRDMRVTSYTCFRVHRGSAEDGEACCAVEHIFENMMFVSLKTSGGLQCIMSSMREEMDGMSGI